MVMTGRSPTINERMA